MHVLMLFSYIFVGRYSHHYVNVFFLFPETEKVFTRILAGPSSCKYSLILFIFILCLYLKYVIFALTISCCNRLMGRGFTISANYVICSLLMDPRNITVYQMNIMFRPCFLYVDPFLVNLSKSFN